jgi:hypothetical protein
MDKEQPEQGGAEKLVREQFEECFKIFEAYLSGEVCDLVSPGIKVSGDGLKPQVIRETTVAYENVLQSRAFAEATLIGALADTPKNREVAERYINLLQQCEAKFEGRAIENEKNK